MARLAAAPERDVEAVCRLPELELLRCWPEPCCWPLELDSLDSPDDRDDEDVLAV
jgi:hypothetical protein